MEFYTVEQAAEKLGVGVATIRRYIKSGKIKAIKAAGKQSPWRIEKTGFDQFCMIRHEESQGRMHLPAETKKTDFLDDVIVNDSTIDFIKTIDGQQKTVSMDIKAFLKLIVEEMKHLPKIDGDKEKYVVDYTEYKFGSRNEGIIFSMQTFVVKLAGAISGFIMGIGLTIIGFVANQEQSATTVTGMRVIMLVIPAVLAILTYLIYLKGFKLRGKFLDEVKAAIANK